MPTGRSHATSLMVAPPGVCREAGGPADEIAAALEGGFEGAAPATSSSSDDSSSDSEGSSGGDDDEEDADEDALLEDELEDMDEDDLDQYRLLMSALRDGEPPDEELMLDADAFMGNSDSE